MKSTSIVLVLATFGAGLAGCTVHRPETRPAPLVPALAGYRERDPDASGERLARAWWTTFQDDTLDHLVESALAANLDLRVLAARIAQADALVRRTGGRLLPTLDAIADYSTLRESSRDREESASVGFELGWELDIWGRVWSARRAAELEARASRQDRETGRLLLSTTVADVYLEAIEQRQQLELLNQQIEVNETLLELTRLRFGQGQSSVVDVLQQREQLASTRSRIPSIEARLAELGLLLDVLLGIPPGSRQPVAIAELPEPPGLPPVGVPASLLENRPDLVALRERVVAIDYRVGEAIADRLPRLRLGGALLGTGRPGIDTLLISGLATALMPLHDGGARRAEVDLSRARLEESLAEYSQAFLTAVEEVEAAMVQERKQVETVNRLEEQLSIGRRLLQETRNRYRQGLTDYLPVLAAVSTVQGLERELITARRLRLSFRIALHQALGGPMARSKPPTVVLSRAE